MLAHSRALSLDDSLILQAAFDTSDVVSGASETKPSEARVVGGFCGPDMPLDSGV